MYNVFYRNNKDEYDSYNYYFTYTKDTYDSAMNEIKLLNAFNKIKADNDKNYKSDEFLMQVKDENVFLQLRFSYSAKLFSFLDDATKIPVPDFLKLNQFYYVNNDCEDLDYLQRQSNYTDILSCYQQTMKDLETQYLFGKRYPDIFVFDNNFFTGHILLLSDKIKKVNKKNYYGYEYNHNNMYLCFDKLNIKNKAKVKTYNFNSNLTYGKDLSDLSSLLKLKNKELKHFYYPNYSIDGQAIFTELVFLRLSDFNIDIKKYENLYEFGKHNKKLSEFFLDIREQSLLHFKNYCNEKTSQLINDLKNKLNFINNIDLNKMFMYKSF